MTTRPSPSAPDPLASHQGDASLPWRELASSYESARSRVDSLDNLVEWPAQRTMLGDVDGMSVLDLGCGNGGKLGILAKEGATRCVGIDVSAEFIEDPPPEVQLIAGDFNQFDTVPEIAEHEFDRILFLQSFGYAQDPVGILRRARSLLSDDGFILLTRTQPIRYALQRAEENGTLVGDEYFASGEFSYASGWNDQVTMTKQRYTTSNLLNTFAQAGLWIEAATEPHLSDEQKRAFPEKHAWANRYLAGILIFRLRPLPSLPAGTASP